MPQGGITTIAGLGTQPPDGLGPVPADSEPANENPAPGEIVAFNGMCLGPLQFSQGTTDASGRVATAIGDIQVSFNGVAAPLLSAQSQPVGGCGSV